MFWKALRNFCCAAGDKWSPQGRQFGDNISNEDGDFLAKTLMILTLAKMAIMMRMINMIMRVIKSDHPGRNCCSRSVVTAGGAVGRYHLFLGGGTDGKTPPASHQ